MVFTPMFVCLIYASLTHSLSAERNRLRVIAPMRHPSWSIISNSMARPNSPWPYGMAVPMTAWYVSGQASEPHVLVCYQAGDGCIRRWNDDERLLCREYSGDLWCQLQPCRLQRYISRFCYKEKYLQVS